MEYFKTEIINNKTLDLIYDKLIVLGDYEARETRLAVQCIINCDQLESPISVEIRKANGQINIFNYLCDGKAAPTEEYSTKGWDKIGKLESFLRDKLNKFH